MNALVHGVDDRWLQLWGTIKGTRVELRLPIKFISFVEKKDSSRIKVITSSLYLHLSND